MNDSSFAKCVYHKIVSKKLRLIIWKVFFSIYSKIKKTHSYEIVEFGSLNPHKIFYLIDFNVGTWGVLCTWLHTMVSVNFAIRRGYVPYIYLKTDWNASGLCDRTSEGINNCWDLYFKQPQSQYTLNNIKNSKKVIILDGISSGIPDMKYIEKIRGCNLPLKKDEFRFWRKMYETCPFSDSIVSYAEKLKDKLFPKNEKLLAVSFRREFEFRHLNNSSYISSESPHTPYGTLSNLISQIKEKLKEYNYKYFFFMVDDREALECVKKEFLDSCIYIERPMLHFFESNKAIQENDLENIYVEYRKSKNYYTVKDYLAGVYLMSKCNSFLSAGSSSDLLAYLINNNQYEHVVKIEASL